MCAYIYICPCVWCMYSKETHIGHTVYPNCLFREFSDMALIRRMFGSGMTDHNMHCVLNVFFVFRNAHRFGNSMFSSVLFCHLVFFVTALSLCVCFHPWCRYPYCTLLLGPSSLSTILLPFCIPCYACKNKSKNCKYQDCPFLVLYLFLSVSKHACVHNLIVSFFFVHP